MRDELVYKIYKDKATDYMHDGPEYEQFLFEWKRTEKHPANGWSLYRFFCDVWMQRKKRERRERYHSKGLNEKFAQPHQLPLAQQKKLEQRMNGVKPTLTVLGIAETPPTLLQPPPTQALATQAPPPAPKKTNKKKMTKKATASKHKRLTQSAAARFIDSAAMDDDDNGTEDERDDEAGYADDGFIAHDDDDEISHEGGVENTEFSHAAMHNTLQLVDSGDASSSDDDDEALRDPPIAAAAKKSEAPVPDERSQESARAKKKRKHAAAVPILLSDPEDDDDDDVEVLAPSTIAAAAPVAPPPPPPQQVSLITPPVSQQKQQEPAVEAVVVAAAAPAAKKPKRSVKKAATTPSVQPLRVRVPAGKRVPLVYEHVFGSEFIRQKCLHTLEQLVFGAGFSFDDAVARLHEMFATDVTMLLPIVELAHMVIVLCRGHLVDQALGLAPNTPSIADRETAREIGALATQRDKLRLETSVQQCAVLVGETSDTNDDTFQRVLPFELLMANRCVSALNFSEHSIKVYAPSMGFVGTPSAAVETVACCLLAPTTRSVHNYEFVCRTLASYLPKRFPRRVIDPQLREPRRLIAPRYAHLFDSIIGRRRFASTCFTRDATQRGGEVVIAAAASTTDASMALDAQLMPPPPPPPSTAAAAKTHFDFMEDDGSAAADIANDINESDPISALSKSLVALGCGVKSGGAATAAAAAVVVPMRRKTPGQKLLVTDRSVVINDVSRLIAVYWRSASLVPNMALVRLFEMLRTAHHTPADREDVLIPVGVGVTRAKDLNKSGALPAYETENNLVTLTLSNLVETRQLGSTVEYLSERMADTTTPFSLFERNVVTSRALADDYIENKPTIVVNKFKEYDLVVMHVLVQFLRLHRQLGTVRIGASAELRDVAVSLSAEDVRGAPIVLGKNELPAAFDFCMPPTMRDLLIAMSERYFRHIGLIVGGEQSTEFIADAEKHFPRLHAAAKFPDDQRWIADYFTTTSSPPVHTPEQMRRFRRIFMPIMAALFPVEPNHIQLNGE